MTKNEFLNRLEQELERKGLTDTQVILMEYEEYFARRTKKGYSEEEISESLGVPEEIAMDYEKLDIDLCPAIVDLPSVRKVKIEVSVLHVKVVRGESLKIFTDDEELIQTIEEGVLKIKGPKKRAFPKDKNQKQLRLILPEECAPDSVKIEIGTGRIEVEEITTGKFRLELGAGDIIVTGVTCVESGISTGTGNIYISDSHVSQSAKTESGAGTIQMARCGSEELKVENGAGTIVLDHVQANEIKAETGVGAIRVAVNDLIDTRIKSGKGFTIDGQKVLSSNYAFGRKLLSLDTGIGSISIETDVSY